MRQVFLKWNPQMTQIHSDGEKDRQTAQELFLLGFHISEEGVELA